MTPASRRPLELATAARPPRRPRVARSPPWRLLVLTGLATLAVLTWYGTRSTERRAIEAMPEAEREAVLARTVDNLRELCGDGAPEGLRDRCRELATFASQFDECRGECEVLVRRQLTPRPTR